MSADQIPNLIKRVARLEERVKTLENRVSELNTGPPPFKSDVAGGNNYGPRQSSRQVEPAVSKKKDQPKPLGKEEPRSLGEPDAHKDSSKPRE